MSQEKSVNLVHVGLVTAILASILGVICGGLLPICLSFQKFNRDFGNFYENLRHTNDKHAELERAGKYVPSPMEMRIRRRREQLKSV
jgi:hypothetical protein